MAYEQRDNSGTLFKNDKKTTDKHPNAKGRAMIGGKMYWVSAWTKQGNQGAFQSLAFEPIDESKQRPQPMHGERPNAVQAEPPEIDEDFIPF